MFNTAVYKILRQALGGKLTSDDQFAVIALINEPSFQPADQEEEPPTCEPPPNPPMQLLTFTTFPSDVRLNRFSQPSRSFPKTQMAGSQLTPRARQALRRRQGPKVTHFGKTPTPPNQVSHQFRRLEAFASFCSVSLGLRLLNGT